MHANQLASQDGKIAGTWGATGGFSLQLFKNLYVWLMVELLSLTIQNLIQNLDF